MKIYYDKKTNHLIIVGKGKDDLPSVTFVNDRGKGRLENIFGMPLKRYLFHCSSISEGYSTQTDKLTFLTENKDMKAVYLKKKRGK